MPLAGAFEKLFAKGSLDTDGGARDHEPVRDTPMTEQEPHDAKASCMMGAYQLSGLPMGVCERIPKRAAGHLRPTRARLINQGHPRKEAHPRKKTASKKEDKR